MRNVHTIGSGKVNNRPVILAADTIQTGDGIIAHNTTIKMNKHTRRNAVISARKEKKVGVPIVTLVSKDIDDEPTSYELEMGKMQEKEERENREKEEREEREEREKAKQTSASKVIDKARAKSVKHNEAIKKSAVQKEGEG